MADDDPYAISSDSDEELPKGPPPKIAIEGRAVSDLSSLKAALNAEKEFTKDERRIEEIAGLKQNEKDKYSKFKDKFEKITDAKADNNDDDDRAYTVESKPKETDATVVRSGLKSNIDDLANISSLAEKKGSWQSSVNEATKVEKSTVIDENTIQTGRVKANLTKFIAGAAGDDADEEDDANADPNIVRSSRKKQKEQLRFEQVGDLKNKWKTGDVETADVVSEDRTSELDELKRGPTVKERFQERQEVDAVVERSYDKDAIDTSLSSEARKSFLHGAAYESAPVEKSVKDDIKFAELGSFKERFEKGGGGGETSPTEKTAVDVHCAELDNIKAAFEKGAGDDGEMTAEERAELKKRQIDAEFIRYKLARRQKQLRDGEQGDTIDEGATKQRPEDEVEFAVAAKAREKFNKIDAKAQSRDTKTEVDNVTASKWNKDKNVSTPEPINRRQIDDYDDEDDADAFEVKNLKSKFENIDKKFVTSSTKPDIDINVEAKELKACFESAMQDETGETIDEKRKRLEMEFKQYKEQKELEKEQQQASSEGDTVVGQQREEIEISADHASKMTAKWEKIQKKEAKKAQRSQMPTKPTSDKTTVIETKTIVRCFVCSSAVYMAERIECDGLLCHRRCLRCKVCSINLRPETYARGPDGLYCIRDHRERFNNMSRSAFVYTTAAKFIV